MQHQLQFFSDPPWILEPGPIPHPTITLFLWSDYYAKGWHDVRRGLSQLLAFIIQHESMYHNSIQEKEARDQGEIREREKREIS